MTLTKKQEELCSTSKTDFSALKALFLNCTLKKSPEMSHTQGPGKRPKTTCQLTAKGRKAFEVYRQNILAVLGS